MNWHRFYQNCEKVNENFRLLLLKKKTATTSAEAKPSAVPASRDSSSESDGDDVDLNEIDNIIEKANEFFNEIVDGVEQEEEEVVDIEPPPVEVNDSLRRRPARRKLPR